MSEPNDFFRPLGIPSFGMPWRLRDLAWPTQEHVDGCIKALEKMLAAEREEPKE